MEIRYEEPPQSRNEAILDSIINGTEYTDPPQSRIEDLLLQLKAAIEECGGVVDSEISHDSVNPVQNKVIAEALDEKANADGANPNLSAGSLLLMDKVLRTNETPYLFRPIPPLSTPYIREKLVGASMVWNQLVYDSYAKNYATSIEKTSSGWVVTSDGTHNTFGAVVKEDSSNHLILNSSHKYFLSVNIKAINVSNFSRLYFNRSSNRYVITQTGRYQTFFYTDSDGSIVLTAETTNASTTSSDSFTFDEFYIIDLTLAFSSAIADRIYSMEQAQAGSGIAWIKSYGFLIDDYYTNDAGSIQSVCADRKEIVGKNLLSVTVTTDTKYGMKLTVDDKGIIWLSGTPTDLAVFNIGSAKVDSSMGNIVLCGISNAVNTMWNTMSLKDKSGSVLYEWINSNNLVKSINLGDYPTVSSVEVTIKRKTNNVAVSGYITPIIAFGTTEVEFEPYHKTTISLWHDELRGVMQLDANNNLVYYGDEKASDGVIDRKFGIVDLGSLTWTYDSTYSRFLAICIGMKKQNARTIQFVCGKYTSVADGRSVQEVPDKSIYNNTVESGVGAGAYIIITDSSYNDATVFGAAMSGVYVIYPLDTPTTEQSTPFESPQYLFDGGTEEFIDYGVEQETRDVAVPVGHVTEYMGAGEDGEVYTLPPLPEGASGDYTVKLTAQSGIITDIQWVEETAANSDSNSQNDNEQEG